MGGRQGSDVTLKTGKAKLVIPSARSTLEEARIRARQGGLDRVARFEAKADERR